MQDRNATHSLRFSIVIPLYDCRDAGDRALAAALEQDYPRERFEVIVVVDARAVPWTSLVSRCTRTVAVDSDFAKVESEIPLFMAGADAARGDYLFFVEAHTVLERYALQKFDEHLKTHADCAIVCGRRRNHARTTLGRLVSLHNEAHEHRTRTDGDFALGANCIIRRSVFERLGGLDPDYMRFAETVLYERVKTSSARVDTIDAVLCTHHNDVGLIRLLRLLLSTGRAKARYYPTIAANQRDGHARRVYRWVDSRHAATFAALPFCLTGITTVLVALAMVPIAPRIAGAAYRAGIGCVNVAGFCFERRRSSRSHGVQPDVGSVHQDA
jgi:hypothetical protein